MIKYKGLLNKHIRQSLVLLVASLGIMSVTLGINSILTGMLSKELFGSYSLVINIFSFCEIIFNFGVFFVIGRLVAQTEDVRRQRAYYGAGLLLTGGVFLVMAFFLYLYAFTLVSAREVRAALLLTIPLGWTFLVNVLYENVLSGSNRIGLLSLSRLLPKLLFLIALGALVLWGGAVGLNGALLLFLLTAVVAYGVVFLWIKPVFENVRQHTLEIWKGVKEFGFNVYIGSVLSVGAGSLSGILIGHFGVTNVEVGYYTLALQLTIPLTLIPNILATTYFRRFVKEEKITGRMQAGVAVVSLTVLMVTALAGKPAIELLYGAEYLPSVPLLYWLAVGSVCYGIADFFSRFLLAGGRGKELRNASFIVGAVLLAANVVLIKMWGASGAAWARIIASVVYLITIIYYYRRVAGNSRTKAV